MAAVKRRERRPIIYDCCAMIYGGRRRIEGWTVVAGCARFRAGLASRVPGSPLSMKDLVFEQLTVALSGRYVPERDLGHGAMASVYLAKDLKHDRLVAIKVL